VIMPTVAAAAVPPQAVTAMTKSSTLPHSVGTKE
jgi:hypothetical protein